VTTSARQDGFGLDWSIMVLLLAAYILLTFVGTA
jgi:hypothetical protein